MGESGPLERGGWDRLSRGLIAYGLVGLAVAAVWLGALVWVSGRISTFRSEVEATIPRLVTTMELTARALHDASTTAQSFRTTLDESAGALSSGAATITQVRSDLSAFEAQLRSVNILGARPLSSPADAVGRIAGSMEGLDTRLSRTAQGLQGSRAALAGNATSLGELGDSVDALAARLDLAVDRGSLGELQIVAVVMLLMCVASTVAPAVGALALGVWLRQQLDRSRAP